MELKPKLTLFLKYSYTGPLFFGFWVESSLRLGLLLLLNGSRGGGGLKVSVLGLLGSGGALLCSF